MTLFSLGKMNAIEIAEESYDHGSVMFLPMLVDCFVNMSDRMDGQELANSLHGLGRISMTMGPFMDATSQQVNSYILYTHERKKDQYL